MKHILKSSGKYLRLWIVESEWIFGCIEWVLVNREIAALALVVDLGLRMFN